MGWQEILPWVTSANTLWAVWLNGHNVRMSWKVSLANQALWLVFIVAFGAWGLLPLTLSLAAVFARHLTRPPAPHSPRIRGRRPAPQPDWVGAMKLCRGTVRPGAVRRMPPTVSADSVSRR